MKNQFKPGDLIGTDRLGWAKQHNAYSKFGADFRGVIVDIEFVEPHWPGMKMRKLDNYWRVTLHITLNRNFNKRFEGNYPVNTVKILTITNLSEWRKINV